MNKSKLKKRCKDILTKIQQDAMLRQNNSLDTLYEFVLAEKGKTAEPVLDDSFPLVLYFATKKDKDDFVVGVCEALPGMTSRKVL